MIHTATSRYGKVQIFRFFTLSPKFDEKTVQKVISETSKGTKKKKTAKSKTRATSMADVVQEVSKVTRKNKKLLGEKLRG